jgi:hypothetical protein
VVLVDTSVKTIITQSKSYAFSSLLCAKRAAVQTFDEADSSAIITRQNMSASEDIISARPVTRPESSFEKLPLELLLLITTSSPSRKNQRRLTVSIRSLCKTMDYMLKNTFLAQYCSSLSITTDRKGLALMRTAANNGNGAYIKRLQINADADKFRENWEDNWKHIVDQMLPSLIHLEEICFKPPSASKKWSQPRLTELQDQWSSLVQYILPQALTHATKLKIINLDGAGEPCSAPLSLSDSIFNHHCQILSKVYLNLRLDVDDGKLVVHLTNTSANLLLDKLETYAGIIGHGCNSLQALRHLSLSFCPKDYNFNEDGNICNSDYTSEHRHFQFSDKLCTTLCLTRITHLSMNFIWTQHDSLATLLQTGTQLESLSLSLVTFKTVDDWDNTTKTFHLLPTCLQTLSLSCLNIEKEGIHFSNVTDSLETYCKKNGIHVKQWYWMCQYRYQQNFSWSSIQGYQIGDCVKDHMDNWWLGNHSFTSLYFPTGQCECMYDGIYQSDDPFGSDHAPQYLK